jgi:hypothetical protein
MPSVDIYFLQHLQESYKKYPVFVETGTNEGVSIRCVEPFFDKLFTIELSPHYYNLASSQYHGNKITFIQGDSSVELGTLLPTIKENTIFFLDGHYSSGNTAKGPKDCPLIEEIEHINNLFEPEAIIIVDDYRLFGRCPKTGLNEDWSDISKGELIRILGSRLTHVYHLDSDMAKDDRLIIHIKAKK